MLSQILDKIIQEITNGTTISKHPFKFGCLSSILNNSPEQRMVVIRKFSGNKLTIYTDSRSPKVAQFIENPNASILFYNHEKMLQVVLKGTVKVIEDKNNSVWKTIPSFAHKDYTTVNAPGTLIDSNESEYNATLPNFCYLEFNFNHIDYLSIESPYNIRAKFKLNDSLKWEGNYVTP